MTAGGSSATLAAAAAAVRRDAASAARAAPVRGLDLGVDDSGVLVPETAAAVVVAAFDVDVGVGGLWRRTPADCWRSTGFFFGSSAVRERPTTGTVLAGEPDGVVLALLALAFSRGDRGVGRSIIDYFFSLVFFFFWFGLVFKVTKKKQRNTHKNKKKQSGALRGCTESNRPAFLNRWRFRDPWSGYSLQPWTPYGPPMDPLWIPADHKLSVHCIFSRP